MILPYKYEFKRFASRTDRVAVVASHLGPLRSASSVRSSTSSSSFPPSPTRNRTHTLPPPKPSIPPATSAPAAPTRTEMVPPSTSANTTMSRSVSTQFRNRPKPLRAAHGPTLLHCKVRLGHLLYHYITYHQHHLLPHLSRQRI